MGGRLGPMTRSVSLFAVGGLVLAACAAPGPADSRSGKPIQTANSISQQERAQGAKAHPELLQEFGGLYSGPQSAYVEQVGRKIAVQSSLSNASGDFTISLLNSPVNNAFAIPGGYVYVTRQLTALMNSEAELAGVLGHEVGHVAAQHGQRRQKAATRNSILGVLGQVLVGAVAGDSAVGGLLQRGIGTGAQLLTLRFSRTQEYEADDLGIRYLSSAGYDPRALSDTLASLARQNALDARLKGTQSGVPEWASTHPDPASRVQRALNVARDTRATGTLRNADVFLTRIDGMLYGEDPKEGVVEGNSFIHPAFRLKFSVPRGFALENGTQAVSISGSGGQAQFTGATYGGDLSAHVAGLFRSLSGNASAGVPAPRLTTINGIPAAYATTRASTQNGQAVDVTIFAYEFGRSTAYHFVTVAPAGAGLGPFEPMVTSITRLSESEAAAIRPRRLRVVTVKAGDTVASLSDRMAYTDYKQDRFLVLNALDANSRLTPGQKVKIVTY